MASIQGQAVVTDLTSLLTQSHY